MAGITVSTSIKFLANAKNVACQIKALKLYVDIFFDSTFGNLVGVKVLIYFGFALILDFKIPLFI